MHLIGWQSVKLKKIGHIASLPLTLFTVNTFVLSRFLNHFHRLKMSSDKDSKIAWILIEAACSGVRDPNLRGVVTEYFTHDSETVCLTLTHRRGMGDMPPEILRFPAKMGVATYLPLTDHIRNYWINLHKCGIVGKSI